MKSQELIDKFKELEVTALTVANLYQQLFWKDSRKISIDKPRKTFDKFYLSSEYTDYKPGFFTVSYEYNNACNCHPEYRNWEEQLPVAWLDFYGVELEEAIQSFINQKYDDRQKEIDNDKRKEEKAKKEKQQEEEKLEREVFQKLKKKYDK
jgi:hypothetical protein